MNVKSLMLHITMSVLLVQSVSARVDVPSSQNRFATVRQRVQGLKDRGMVTGAGAQLIIDLATSHERELAQGTGTDSAGYKKLATMLETVASDPQAFAHRAQLMQEYVDTRQQLTSSQKKLSPDLYEALAADSYDRIARIEEELGVTQSFKQSLMRKLRRNWKTIAAALFATGATVYGIHRVSKQAKRKKGRATFAELKKSEDKSKFLSDLDDASFDRMVVGLDRSDLYEMTDGEEKGLTPQAAHIKAAMEQRKKTDTKLYKQLFVTPGQEPSKESAPTSSDADGEEAAELTDEDESTAEQGGTSTPQPEEEEAVLVRNKWQAFVERSAEEQLKHLEKLKFFGLMTRKKDTKRKLVLQLLSGVTPEQRDKLSQQVQQKISEYAIRMKHDVEKKKPGTDEFGGVSPLDNLIIEQTGEKK